MYAKVTMVDFYVLTHREAGPLTTFLIYEEAEQELRAVLEDEPTWVPDLWVEPFNVVVTERAPRA